MSGSSTATGGKIGRTVRIMLVDDNDGDVLLLEKSLRARDLPYELLRYEDGEQAIRAISGDRALVPDLILVDLNLPGIEGFDVLSMVRTVPRLVGIPVAVLTSSNAAADRSRTALIGAEKYIHKPPTLEKFIDQVGRAVEELLALGPSRETAPGTDPIAGKAL